MNYYTFLLQYKKTYLHYNQTMTLMIHRIMLN